MGQYNSFMDDSLTPCELNLDPFVFFSEVSEKKAPPELRQAFEVATGQNSGLVKLVFSRQTVFFLVRASFY